jgi:hypothetical protein
MKQDRFLTGILIGIGVLIVAALVLFFVRKESETYIDDSTPEGVVHNYIVALHKHDYEKAYGYLAEKQYKPTIDVFKKAFLSNAINLSNNGAEIGETQLSGSDAYVTVYTIYNSSDPFSSEYRNTESANLTKQDGAWKLTQMPYNFWSYDWYQQPYDVKP